MKAVIMAGGQGSRLRPLTCDLPKPMVPVVNYPVMEYIIDLLREQGIRDIAVTAFYLPEKIESYFGNGERWGVNLHYFIEEEALGTAGSVHNAAEFLDETFIVVSGDAITDFDFTDAIRFHQEEGADATLILAKENIPLDYGVVMTDDDGRVIRFLEKPDWGQVFSDTINTGIYILEPKIFELYEKNKKFDFSRDLFPLMLNRNMDLCAVALEGYWNDIGNIKEYHQTQFDLLTGRVKVGKKACVVLEENIYLENGVDLDESVELRGPVYIGEGSRVEAGAYLANCIIGRNCRIDKNTSIKNSVIWDNNYIESNVEIRGAILANNVTVRKRAAIFDLATVGRNVVIGTGSRLKPEVKIWPEKEIEDEAVVDTNIVWPENWRRNIFCHRGVIGDSNIDITPDFVSNLAAAYGSTLKRGDNIVISSDVYKISSVLKRAFISGLQAAGIHVIDIGETITPVTRFSVVDLEAKGGVHIRVASTEPEKIIIEFLNETGVHISTNEQKEIEKHLFTGEYHRVFIDEIGDFAYTPDMPVKYLDELTASIDLENIRRNYFSVVMDYEYDSLGDLFTLLLRRLNCQILSTRNYSPGVLPMSIEERLEARDRVKRIIRDNNSDLGIIIDHNGEELHLISRQGRVLSKAEYQLLISYILLERGIKYLPVPVNTPLVLESLAEEYGAVLEYTPVNPQVAMDRYYENSKEQVKEVKILRFYPYQDGLAGLALILEEMARLNISLDGLLNRLPEFYLNNAEIACDWKEKGRVMRQLGKESNNMEQMIDGIKFRHNNGWALVIPDSERPVFHIYAEGQDMESAESLTGFYLEKVKEIIDGIKEN
ncbi:MAG: sugar phosphate nucleotidyltransferase [Halanaerobiales bacterium]